MSEEIEKKFAFVIMPFDAAFNGIYESIIKKSLIAAGYRVERADSLMDRQNIIKKIVINIRNADLIVADLTDNNPNVFYELGICHAKGKPVLILTQNISELPFDLKQYVAEVYSRDFEDVSRFAASFEELAREFSIGNFKIENPVTDFWEVNSETVDSKTLKTDSDQQMDVMAEEEEEDGILDVRLKFDTSIDVMTASIAKISKLIEKMGTELGKKTSQLELANQNNSTVAVHRIVSEAAKILLDYSNKCTVENSIFEKSSAETVIHTQRLMSFWEDNNEDDIKAISDLIDILKESEKIQNSFLFSIVETKKQNVSKSWVYAAKKAEKAVKDTSNIMKRLRLGLVDLLDSKV